MNTQFRNTLLLKDYLENKLSRLDLSKKYDLGLRTVRVILRRMGVKESDLWDTEHRLNNEKYKLLIHDYTVNKIPRKELSKKYHIPYKNLYSIILRFNEKVWDMKQVKKKQKKKESKYFSKSDLTDNLFVYWYNRG